MRSALVTSTKMVAVFRPTDAGCHVVRPAAHPVNAEVFGGGGIQVPVQ